MSIAKAGIVTSIISLAILSGFSLNSNGQPAETSSVDIKKILQTTVPLIDVEYQSSSMIVIKGDEDTLLLTNGTTSPFWNAIDVVKQHGYSLNEVTTSGMGSQGNPTRFYAILSKP